PERPHLRHRKQGTTTQESREGIAYGAYCRRIHPAPSTLDGESGRRRKRSGRHPCTPRLPRTPHVRAPPSHTRRSHPGHTKQRERAGCRKSTDPYAPYHPIPRDTSADRGSTRLDGRRASSVQRRVPHSEADAGARTRAWYARPETDIFVLLSALRIPNDEEATSASSHACAATSTSRAHETEKGKRRHEGTRSGRCDSAAPSHETLASTEGAPSSSTA
ncbi:hypothetical protein DFH08DRAFT_1042074, partial [Mycena albidolilacea]